MIKRQLPAKEAKDSKRGKGCNGGKGRAKEGKRYKEAQGDKQRRQNLVKGVKEANVGKERKGEWRQSGKGKVEQAIYSGAKWVTGIQEKQEWNMGTETCKIGRYSSDSSPVRFTELYNLSHWCTIVAKFFLEFFLLHNAYEISTRAKQYID